MSQLLELQQAVFSSDLRIAPLYYRHRNLAATEPEPRAPVVEKRATLILPAFCEVDLGTYFGSFFESYWRRHTAVKDVVLRLTLKGEARLRLLRHSQEHGTEIVYESEVEGTGEQIVIPVPPPDSCRTAHGQLSLKIFARAPDVVVSYIAWCTDTPPKRHARLAVAICTFNRESDLTATMEALRPVQAAGKIDDIFIVNHGAAGLEKRLRQQLNKCSHAARFVVREQENLGGAGGFTRGIIEAVDHGQATHVLLMDDDIQLDSEVVLRISTLLCYLNDGVAVGGAMLDRLRPTWLHEAGGYLDPMRFGMSPLHCDMDLADSKNVERLSTVLFPDYNAWWCFAFPLAALGEAGLPLPLFIHADDMEFGLRLRKAANHITISWPGIAVWHEPSYLKLDWKGYYDVRNGLFLMESHGLLQRATACSQVKAKFAWHMMRFNYYRAWLVCRAVEDFGRGAEVLADWNAAAHQAIVAGRAVWSEPEMPRTIDLPPLHLTGRPPRCRRLWAPLAVVRVLTDALRSRRKGGGLATLRSHEWQMRVPPIGSDGDGAAGSGRGIFIHDETQAWGLAGLDSYAVTNERSDTILVFRRDRRKAWALLWQFAKAYVGLRRALKHRRDPAKFQRLTGTEYWRDRLAMSGPQDTRVEDWIAACREAR